MFENIAITPENIHIAWKLLVDRCNNPRIISARHLKASSAWGSHQDYHRVISEGSSNFNAF